MMDHFDRNSFIRTFPYFKNCPETLVTELLSSAWVRSVPKNMLMELEGDHCQYFLLMLSGIKRIYKATDNGREITLYEIGPGDICVLNALCVLTENELPANAVSVTDVKMLLVPAQVFTDMATRYAELRSFLYARINECLVQTIHLLSEIVFGKMDARLTDYLMNKSRDGRLNITHNRIAQDLGTSREVISRLLKEMERQKIIRLSRNSIQLKLM